MTSVFIQNASNRSGVRNAFSGHLFSLIRGAKRNRRGVKLNGCPSKRLSPPTVSHPLRIVFVTSVPEWLRSGRRMWAGCRNAAETRVKRNGEGREGADMAPCAFMEWIRARASRAGGMGGGVGGGMGRAGCPKNRPETPPDASGGRTGVDRGAFVAYVAPFPREACFPSCCSLSCSSFTRSLPRSSWV